MSKVLVPGAKPGAPVSIRCESRNLDAVALFGQSHHCSVGSAFPALRAVQQPTNSWKVACFLEIQARRTTGISELLFPTVLLVDDDTQQLQLRSQVMKLCGFSVITSYSPVKALR
jgi:hypothetical protein